MNIALQEGRLRIDLPSNASGWKFDSKSHGLSHAMKAVDFIVKSQDAVWFIEIKDPSHPNVPQKEQAKFLQNLRSDGMDIDLVRKYRDSWLYLWACEEVGGFIECHYYVIIVSDFLDNVLLEQRTNALQKILPLDDPGGKWRRKFAMECGVFNMESWNQRFADYPITIQQTI